MSTPLDIAMEIGRIVDETRAAQLPLDLLTSLEDLLSRHPESGVARGAILDALKEEAGAAGLTMN
jgi:hypothetical protein